MAGEAPIAGGRSAGALAIAAGMVAIGAFVLWQGWTIGAEQSSYARVGPQLFPYIVGTGLIIIGVLLGFEAVRNGWTAVWVDTTDENGEARPGARAAWRQFANVALVAVGLILNAALIGDLGFIIASTTMFALTTRAFGSRRPLFDIVVGAVFSGAIFLIFVYLLGLPLPAGHLWGGR